MDRKPIESSRKAAGTCTAAALIALMLPLWGARAQSAGETRPQSLLPDEYQARPAAQPQPQVDRTDETLDKAGDIAIQPARDVGIGKARIPLVLQEAVQDPYKPLHRQNCAWVDYELARLNQALGPDFGVGEKGNEDKATQIALAGGEMLVNSLIPFRGLVREISGAAPADRRKAAAINAGLARRGYVRGLGAILNCPARVTTAAK